MFIEKLKDEEILNFLNDYVFVFPECNKEHCRVNRYSGAVSVMIKLSNGKIMIFTMDDFVIESAQLQTGGKMVNYQWKKFMHQKFGDEYKQAFNEQLKKKYEQELIK